MPKRKRPEREAAERWLRNNKMEMLDVDKVLDLLDSAGDVETLERMFREGDVTIPILLKR
jgi:hypothetical protein